MHTQARYTRAFRVPVNQKRVTTMSRMNELYTAAAQRHPHPETLTVNQALYLDWVNNFLTVSKFADYYGITEAHAIAIIDSERAKSA